MIEFNFKEVEIGFDEKVGAQYSDSCSGSRSDCCTRVCTKNERASDEGKLTDWDKYLEVDAGVLQY